MQVDIVCPVQGYISSSRAVMTVVAAEMGDVGIAPGHAPLLARIKPGVIRIRAKQQEDEQTYFVSGGFLEVQPYAVTILADTIERAADIDAEAAEQARQRAREAMKRAHDRGERDRAHAQLIMAIARIKAVRTWKAKY